MLDEISLLKIFSHLSARSLNTCMLVCKSWNKLANEVKEKRKRTVETIFYSSPSSNDDLDDLKESVKSQLELFRLEPDLSLLFLTNTTNDEVNVDNRESGRASKERPKDVLKKILIPSTRSIFIYTAGIIGTNFSNTCTLEVESLDDEMAFSGLFFPKSNNFDINVLKLSNKMKLPEYKDLQELNEFFGVNEGEELKYLIVIGDKKCKVKLTGLFKFINAREIDKCKLSLYGNGSENPKLIYWI